MSGKSSKKMAKKSALAKQAEKLFSYENSNPPVIAETSYPTYWTEPVIVQTFTTYSVCEDPIPNFHKR